MVYIESGIRTPFGLLNGSLAQKTATEMLATVFEYYKKDAISHIIMDCVLQAGLGYAPIQYACNTANISSKISHTLVKSGTFHSFFYAFHHMKNSDCANYLVGGFESITNAPYLVSSRLSRLPFGQPQFFDSVYDELIVHPKNTEVAKIVEDLADVCRITRRDQEEYSYKDYEKVLSNLQDIAAVIVPEGSHDENLDLIEPAKFSKAASVYKAGQITKNTMAPLCDGACVLKLSSKQGLAAIKDVMIFASKPASFIETAIKAIETICKKLTWEVQDIDLFEINENFAVTPIAIAQKLNLDFGTVNVWGGALSLGHPFSASCARSVLNLARQLSVYKKHKGLACLASVKGEVTVIALERPHT